MRADVLKVVIRWFVEEVLNTGNLEAVDELFAPDYIAHVPLDPEPVRGGVAWKQRLTTYLAAFPDLHVTLEDLVAERDTVVARLTWSGTQRALFLGVSATNRRVAVAGMYAWRIADGKMHEEWIAEDLLSLMQQLGALPKSPIEAVCAAKPRADRAAQPTRCMPHGASDYLLKDV